MRFLCLGAVLLLAATGCVRGESDGRDTARDSSAVAGAPNTERARSAAAVADAIAANPSAADSILTAAGYTRESFQRLMYEIAADSGMSAAYASAKTR